MKTLTCLADLPTPELHEHFCSKMVAGGVPEEDINSQALFQDLIGGDILIIEKALDLASIPIILDYSEVTPCGKYLEQFAVTNNGGGNVYLIPIDIANFMELAMDSYKEIGHA